MQITEIDGFNARCQAKGEERTVSLFMLQFDDIGVGDFIIIHQGNAVQKISEQDAQKTWELLDQIVEETNEIESKYVR
jgi:hydrogenase expression/formation protein HypC